MTAPTPFEVAQRLVILRYQVVHAIAIPQPEDFQKVYASWPKFEKKRFTAEFEKRSDQLVDSMKSLDLWKTMTKDERDFVKSIPPNVVAQKHINAMWCLESAVTLMWALGLIDKFPPFDVESDMELLKKVPHENLRGFLSEADFIEIERIEKMRDLAELWHWRSRTRELLERGDMPDKGSGYSSYDEIARQAAQMAFENGDIAEVIDSDFPAMGKAFRDLNDDEWSFVRSISIERHKALNWLCGYADDNRWDETPTDT